MAKTIRRALVVVDVQNDFCPGGTLAVTHGDEVAEPLNRVIDFAVQNGWFAVQNDWDIYFSRDWHPAKTKHFEKWPPHCVQNTHGAEFHPNLRQPKDYPKFRVISKGLGDADDYSAFDGGMRPEAEELYVGGLATDYCVLWTVKRAIELGYKVVLMIDACRAVNPEDGKNAVEEMIALGAVVKTTTEVLYELGE